MRPSRFISAQLAVACMAATALTMFVISVSGVAAAPTKAGSWPYPNGDLSNTRDAGGSTITLANVSTLKKAWSFKLSGKATKGVGGYGTLAANPVVVNGVVYIQDLHSNVYALSLATGKLLWSYAVNKNELSGPGPNGVAVANGTVYGATPKSVFALNATTGKKVWSNDHLLKSGQGTFGIQPEVADGRVYLASQYGHVPGGGLLLAVNASTGRLIWTFKTEPKDDAGPAALTLGGGGAWETPLVNANGSVSFGVGNPYQSLGEAMGHPTQALYTDSVVNLNAATGQLNWYYQGISDDFMDHDMQASPIAASANGVPVVLGSGKLGIVYEMNAATGKLLWKTPVGVHNGTDYAGLHALEGKGAVKLPFIYEPGAYGGVLTNMALSGNTLYAATINLPFKISKSASVNGLPVGINSKHVKLMGEVDALNVTTGKVEWATTVNGMPDGATTVSNNVVFTTLLQGELVALDSVTGKIVYTTQLPRSTNAPIAIAGNTIIVPTGGPKYGSNRGPSQIVAYTVPST
jgi:alcohol dehydrogenase (cytochrome c)